MEISGERNTLTVSNGAVFSKKLFSEINLRLSEFHVLVSNGIIFYYFGIPTAIKFSVRLEGIFGCRDLHTLFFSEEHSFKDAPFKKITFLQPLSQNTLPCTRRGIFI